MVPFDRTKPLIAKRVAFVPDPSVRATVDSLPSAATNRYNAEVICFTSTRTRYCLKNLHSIDIKIHSLIVCKIQIENETGRKDQFTCLLSMYRNLVFTFQHMDQNQ